MSHVASFKHSDGTFKKASSIIESLSWRKSLPNGTGKRAALGPNAMFNMSDI